MGALAFGLVVLVAAGIYLWTRLPGKRWSGVAALALGMACCGSFLFGLGILF